MNREELKKILPHREPMLLIDEAERTAEKTSTGKYTVRGDEWFLQGHFPGHPVVPGVMLCEMVAQTGAVVIADKLEGRLAVYAGIKNARFKRSVQPGDTLDMEVTITREKGPFFFTEGKGYVNGELAVSGEFSFALVKGV